MALISKCSVYLCNCFFSFFSLPLLTNFSGWWFDACGPSNLNGMFYTAGQNHGKLNGIKWHYFKGPSYSLRSTTMMIRPLDFWRHNVKSNLKGHQEIWRSHQMRNCLETSEANNIVSLPAASSSYVKSPRFLTVNLEPFDFTEASPWGDCVHMAWLQRMPLTVML